MDDALVGTQDDQSQRHRRDPRIRSRASRACDRCKGRKTRCSGKYPCALCSRLNLDCRYTASYRRGRLPPIEVDEGLSMAEAVGQEELEPIISSQIQPSVTTAHEQHVPSPVSIEARRPDNNVSTAAQSSRNSPEPAPVDNEGLYVGEASGASFLLRVQRKLLHQRTASSSESSIFTFGDLPLPELESTHFLILPPRSVAEELLARYFEFASATHRYLHRGTVEEWLSALYDTHGSMRGHMDARSKTAVLLMVFAHAENFPKSRAGAVDPAASARFFSAAEDQLSAEKGAIRLTSVQARLAQCFYLLSHSRLNHCWSLFGTAAHLMLALGIHRKTRIDPNSTPDYVELECRKRTFWCAYNLDTYLSAALGRPRTFQDKDIDQEIPICVDDARIGRGLPAPSPAVGIQSVMSGCCAHIKLSRIVGNVLSELYGLRPQPTDAQYTFAAKFTQEIETWRNSVSYLVDTNGVDPTLFQPIFLRQRNVLSLACWHAEILVHRPFLLNNFASLANLGHTRHARNRHNSALTTEHVEKCLNAAMNIVAKINDLASAGQFYNTLWFSHYFAFSAVVVLYVYAIQQRHAAPETYTTAYNAATRCQEQLTSIAMPGSLAERYGVVLQELRSEVLRHNSHLASLESGQDASLHASARALLEPNPSHPLPRNGSHNVHFAINGEAISGDDADRDFGMMSESAFNFSEQSPDSAIVQMMGWGQFDSLVAGGMSDLEPFFGDNNIQGWNLGMDPAH